MISHEQVAASSGPKSPGRVAAVPRPGQCRRRSGNEGFTLVELIVVSAILGVLAIMVIPAYNRFVEVVKVSRCSSEIRGLEKDVYAYFVDKNILPASLNDIGRSGLLDPWGNAYQYLQGGGARVLFGNPLNDDFDLYSKGQNGVSPASILDADSQDDVVRAREGGWVGSVVTFFD